MQNEAFISCLKVMKEQKEKLKYLTILVHQTVKVFECQSIWITYFYVNIKKK